MGGTTGLKTTVSNQRFDLSSNSQEICYKKQDSFFFNNRGVAKNIERKPQRGNILTRIHTKKESVLENLIRQHLDNIQNLTKYRQILTYPTFSEQSCHHKICQSSLIQTRSNLRFETVISTPVTPPSSKKTTFNVETFISDDLYHATQIFKKKHNIQSIIQRIESNEMVTYNVNHDGNIVTNNKYSQ